MKRLLLFLLVSLYSQLSLAELQMERDANNRLLLSHESCDELIKNTKVLDQWTKNSHEKKSCPVNFQSPVQKNNRCSYDVTDCLPDHVIKYGGVSPKYNGPNCWNLALVMKNILPALRHTTNEEMAFYMSSPLCRQIKNGEPKIPGDVGAIRKTSGVDQGEYHGFIYISDNLVYSKNGLAKENPYMILSTNIMMDVYTVPKDPKCRKNEMDPSANCDFSTSYFRCMSMEEYLAKQNTPKEIMTAIRDVDNFDKCLESTTLSDQPLSKRAEKNLFDSLNVISNYLYDETEKAKGSDLEDPKQIFMLASLNLKLNAIAMQLGGDNKVGYGTAVQGFSEHIKALTEELKGKK
ncbi:hypothetical protein SHI21_02740 [Bacteriovorax sp. PP10]|uniref:Uncharacterized protein n=1 Tax=Bacteriovorax antarcticus TaxID=3088717 RepID=A0ABU5VR47_9BACT|nr:hypothetical protein [Bacteriovorax sp. PP10]MEA9355097.1 hypothetical protein [Bacteriovorax sp. PP10]